MLACIVIGNYDLFLHILLSRVTGGAVVNSKVGAALYRTPLQIKTVCFFCHSNTFCHLKFTKDDIFEKTINIRLRATSSTLKRLMQTIIKRNCM